MKVATHRVWHYGGNRSALFVLWQSGLSQVNTINFLLLWADSVTLQLGNILGILKTWCFSHIFRFTRSQQPGMSCNCSEMLKTNDIRGKLLGSGSVYCSDYLNIPVEQFILLHGTVFFSHIPLMRRAGLSKLCAQRAGEPSGDFFIRQISVWSGQKIKLLEPLSKQTFQNHVKNW